MGQKTIPTFAASGDKVWERASIFWKNLIEGKAPLWIVFWLIHMIPAVIANLLIFSANQAYEDEVASGIFIVYVLYFAFSGYLVVKTAWGRERDWDKPYNDAFFYQAAILIVGIQAISPLIKLFLY